MKGIKYFFATFFYCGYFPLAPGTFASLITGILGYVVLSLFGMNALTIFFLVVTALGFAVSGEVEKYEGKKDPSIVVIDEASGILISMLMVSFFINNHILNLILSFAFFRLYDISKLYPVNKIERIKGGSGIMLDDIAAGIMAGLTALAIIFLWRKMI